MSAAPGPRTPGIVTVARVADYLRRRLEADANLKHLRVRGEVTGVFRQANGHVNFALKDSEALINCFAFASDAERFATRLENGQAVVATGSVTTYAQKSTYQLLVRAIELEGVGDLHAIFEERKRKLAAQGLFRAERKRPLPRYPFRVGLVSSRSANGAQDFVKLLSDRAPHVRIVWFETLVQGPNAPDEVARAIGRASRADLDCIVVTRGGGSFEDLFWFSDEKIVRAVAAASHPTISAIGHTADQQLCDFAADAHFETPSAAAKAIGSSLAELQASIDDRTRRAGAALALRAERLSSRLSRALVRSRLADSRLFLAPLAQRVGDLDAGLGTAAGAAIRAREFRVRALAKRLDVFDPRAQLAERAHRLARASQALGALAAASLERARTRARAATIRLEPSARGALARRGNELALVRTQLTGNDPEAILQRGYAIVMHRGAIVRDPAALEPGAAIKARVARGTVFARVESEGNHGN